MKNITWLCVAMIGAALPATLEAGHRDPVYSANANYGIAAGGCFGPSYRPQAVQQVTTNYAPGSSYNQCPFNCPPGQCTHLTYSAGTADYCPTGQCLPRNHAAGAADYCPNGQCLPGTHTATMAGCINGRCNHPNHTVGTAACPINGYCPTHGVYHSARAGYQGSSNWQGSRYNTLPANWNSNPYPARPAYDTNRSNSYRPVQPTSFGTTASPFFN